MNFRHEKIFGGKGTAPDQFLETLPGVAVDDRDRLLAAGDDSVKVFDSKGILAKRWDVGQPVLCVAVEQESVYVGEEGRVEIFEASSGRSIHTFHDSRLMGRVTAIGLFDEWMLIADSMARCIRRFDREGRLINNIGDANRMKGFNIPNGALDFAIDSRGVIHACNPGKHRVEQYTLSGELLGHIGRFDGRDPEGFSGCCNPTNVAVADQRLLYVTEKAGPRAKVLDLAGHLVAVIATDVFDLNCKNMDLAVDSRGAVYVADTVRLQIHRFVPENGNGSMEREQV